MRKKFTMSPAQREKILDASKPVRYMVIGGVEPRSPQENANQAWKELGKELGFDWQTARPIGGASNLEFSAEIAETGDEHG